MTLFLNLKNEANYFLLTFFVDFFDTIFLLATFLTAGFLAGLVASFANLSAPFRAAAERSSFSNLAWSWLCTP